MGVADSKSTSSATAGSPHEFNFRHQFARQWRESVRYFGFWRALRELAAACWRAALELLPSRRKARFGDLDYDWEHEVDTTRSNVSFRTQLLAELAGRPYYASDPWLFEQMMQALPINCRDFTFIDLGSGKGRALLMAAKYRFKRVIGVEFMPEWHLAADENIRKFRTRNGSAPTIESFCMDARDFEFPNEPSVVYLFNPFPEAVFVAVLAKVRRSIETTPRTAFIAYRFPEFEKHLDESGWLQKVASTQQWAVYKNQVTRPAGSVQSTK